MSLLLQIEVLKMQTELWLSQVPHCMPMLLFGLLLNDCGSALQISSSAYVYVDTRACFLPHPTTVLVTWKF